MVVQYQRFWLKSQLCLTEMLIIHVGVRLTDESETNFLLWLLRLRLSASSASSAPTRSEKQCFHYLRVGGDLKIMRSWFIYLSASQHDAIHTRCNLRAEKKNLLIIAYLFSYYYMFVSLVIIIVLISSWIPAVIDSLRFNIEITTRTAATNKN